MVFLWGPLLRSFQFNVHKAAKERFDMKGQKIKLEGCVKMKSEELTKGKRKHRPSRYDGRLVGRTDGWSAGRSADAGGRPEDLKDFCPSA